MTSISPPPTTTTLTATHAPNGDLLIRVPRSSSSSSSSSSPHPPPPPLAALVPLPCPSCPHMETRVQELQARVGELSTELSVPCSVCPELRARIEETKSASELLQVFGDSLSDKQRIGQLEEQVRLLQPAYQREQERLQKATSARIGEEGERDVYERLLKLLRSHADVKITNAAKEAGDLQLRWRMAGAEREALVTVEVKTSENEGGMVQKRWLHQAAQQVQRNDADAGLLLYTGAVDAQRTLVVEEGSRLVVVGCSRDPGQLLSGVLHAFLLAQQRVACEQVRGEMVTEDDRAATRYVVDLMEDRVAGSRKALYDVQQLATKALKEEKQKVRGVCAGVDALGPVPASLFSPTFKSRIALPREKLMLSGGGGRGAVAGRGAAAAAEKRKKKRKLGGGVVGALQRGWGGEAEAEK